MPVQRPSVLLDEFDVLDPIWNVFIDSSSNPEHSWYTSDYVGELFLQPAPLRGWHCAYALQKNRSPAQQVIRHSLDSYGNAGGGKMLVRADTIPQFGQGMLSLNLNGARRSPVAARSSAIQQALGGYAWLHDKFSDGWGGAFYPVVTANRTESPYIARRVGTYVCRWRTTIPSAGIDREWMRRYDYGAGISGAEFWFENTGPNIFIHNPTQFGCNNRSLLAPDINHDENIRMASPIVASALSQSAGRLSTDCTQIPLEWSKGDNGSGGPPGSGDHGGDDWHPVIWRRCLQRNTIDVNWQGIEGVHLIRFAGFTPFKIPLCALTAFGCGVTTMDTFDEAYFYDAAIDTLTNLSWSFAVNGQTKYDNDIKKFTVESPPGTVVSTGASKTPSGYGAAIIRAGGAQYGPGDGLCIGLYSKLGESIDDSHSGGPMRPGVNTLLILMNHNPAETPDPDQATVQSVNVQAEATRRDAGWLGQQAWMVTGTLTDVRTKIRSLYLSGVGAAEWTP